MKYIKNNLLPCINFLAISIQTAQSARYLGVIVDTKLNGMTHVAYIKESIANYVICLHSLSRRYCGLSGVS